MPYGPAYWSDQIRDPSEAPQSPLFKRLAPAGPWSYASASWQGKPGVAAIWGNVVEPLEKYGAARTCSDGLVYCAPIVMPSQVELGKKSYTKGIDYTTNANITLTIPLALSAPRKLAFSFNRTMGDFATPFGQQAKAVFDRLAEQSVSIFDPDVELLIYLAIAENYRITVDMLVDLEWIQSPDIDNILCCILGSDPKAFASGATISPVSPLALSGAPC